MLTLRNVVEILGLPPQRVMFSGVGVIREALEFARGISDLDANEHEAHLPPATSVALGLRAGLRDERGIDRHCARLPRRSNRVHGVDEWRGRHEQPPRHLT